MRRRWHHRSVARVRCQVDQKPRSEICIDHQRNRDLRDAVQRHLLPAEPQASAHLTYPSLPATSAQSSIPSFRVLTAVLSPVRAFPHKSVTHVFGTFFYLCLGTVTVAYRSDPEHHLHLEHWTNLLGSIESGFSESA